MMTAEQLRGSILQLAMQGKLEEQRPEEGTGEELFKEIQVEKALLYKKRLISKGKKMPPLREDEIPFQIPKSWLWTKLGRVVNDILVPMRDKPKVFNGTIPWCRIEDIEGKYLNGTKTNKYVSEKTIKQMNLRVNPAGTVISANSASVGAAAITTTPCCTNQTFVGLVCSHGLYNEFLYYYLKANTKTIRKMGTGTTILYVSQEKYWNMPFPLPPLLEQKRIVAKIEELMPYVEQYAAASTKLNTLNTTFPDMIKKSILQEAVQGKLVPQDPNDEPANALLKKIAEEKKRLIKEGKIKKQRALPEITEDEIPFDIPESWEWIRLGDLTELITKGSSPKWQGINYVNEGLLFVTSENVGVEELLWSNKKYVDFRFNDISPRSILKKGDLLTNIVGASIGRTAVYDLDEVANINQAVCLIRLINQDLAPYILMHLNSPIAYRIMMADKVETARPNISLTNITEFLVPLPPLKEQKRIIEKLRIIDEHIKRLCLN